MSRSKKGFTIVELVIVIAVVAILAAVLIPSFSSLNKKAKDSAYLQERTNQQIADLAEKVENQKFLTWEDLEAKLAEELAKLGTGAKTEDVEDAIAAALAKFENSLKTDDTALTEAQVKAIVEKALEGQLTTAQVEAVVNAAVAKIPAAGGSELTPDQVKTIVENAVAGLNKQTGITKEEMEAAVAKAITDAMPEQEETVTEQQIKDIVTNALAGFGYGNDPSISDIQSIIEAAMGKVPATADEQAVAEMNAVIKNITEFNKAVEALTAAGYNVSALTPITANKIFSWDDTNKKIVCVTDDGTNKDIVAEGAGLIVAEVKDATGLKKAVANGNAITLEADVAYNEHSLTVASGNVTIDLNGHTLTLPEYNNGIVDRHSYVEVSAGATLTLVGGTVEARGVQAYKDGELIIKGTKVVALDTDGGSAIYAWAGSKITVEGGEFIASEQAECVINAGGEVVIKDGTFTHTLANTELRPYAIETKDGGTTTIENATVTGTRGIFACKKDGSITTVNGGTYKTDGLNGGWCVYTDRDDNASSTAKVVINGGTFVGPQMFYGNYEDKR